MYVNGKWKCTGFDSCFECPYADCIHGDEADAPPKSRRPLEKAICRGHRGGKPQMPIEVIDVITGKITRYACKEACAVAFNRTGPAIEYRVKTGKIYDGCRFRKAQHDA